MLFNSGVKKCISGIVMFVPVFQLNNIAINFVVRILIQISSGACIYILMLLLLNDEWTLHFVKGVIKKKKLLSRKQ